MGNLFSKKKKNTDELQITEIDRAVLGLKSTKKKLEAYQNRLEEMNSNAMIRAKQLKSEGKNNQAIQLLQRRIMQKQFVEKLNKLILNSEAQLADIEIAKQQQQFVAAIDIGNKALQSILETMPLSKVEKVLEEARESRDNLDTIQSLLNDEASAESQQAAEEEFKLLGLESNGPLQVDSPDKVLEDEMPNAPTTAINTAAEDQPAINESDIHQEETAVPA